MESKIQKMIELNLPLQCRYVVHIDRLNSGMIRIGSGFMRLCKAGTPDLYAILDYDGGHFLFIEVKSPKGRQTFEQKRFEYMVKDLDHIHYILARSTRDVVKYIEKKIFK